MANERKKTFLREGLEKLVDKDSPLRVYFEGDDGARLEDNVYAKRKDQLRESLTKAYDAKIAPRYDKRGFLQNAITGALRGLAGMAYAGSIATIAPTPLLNPVASWGATKIGIGLSAAADAVDTSYYKNQGQIGGLGKTSARALRDKAIGYIPGGGLWDLYNSRKKFEIATDEHLGRPSEDKDTMDYAVKNFLDKVNIVEEHGRRILPLAAIRDKRYTGRPSTKNAIAA